MTKSDEGKTFAWASIQQITKAINEVSSALIQTNDSVARSHVESAMTALGKASEDLTRAKVLLDLAIEQTQSDQP